MGSRVRAMWEVQEHQCAHDWHGYSQPGRYGDGEGVCEVATCIGTVEVPQGDRDCTSSIKIAANAVGIPTAGYYYTGNLREELAKAGWEWHCKSDPKIMGDVMYYHRGGSDGHAAMCDGHGNLGEFCIAETGGIDGAVGDQTGWESRIVPFYDPGWDGFMRYVEQSAPFEDPARSVQLWPSNGTDAQRWYPVHNDDGTVSLRNAACGKYLDVMGGSDSSGAPCQVYPGNGTAAQRWRIVRRDGAYVPDDVRPVEIVPAANGALRLDVAGGSDEAGAGIQVWEANGTPAQQWYVMDGGDGAWTIVNNAAGSKLALDVAAGGA